MNMNTVNQLYFHIFVFNVLFSTIYFAGCQTGLYLYNKDNFASIYFCEFLISCKNKLLMKVNALRLGHTGERICTGGRTD